MDTATFELYTLSLHDALPISSSWQARSAPGVSKASSASCRATLQARAARAPDRRSRFSRDRKSTRLNSSHEWISYAVFCLKKKMGLRIVTEVKTEDGIHAQRD